MNLDNRSLWLGIGVGCCTLSGAFLGAAIGFGGGGDGGAAGFAFTLIGLITGLAVGIYGARWTNSK